MQPDPYLISIAKADVEGVSPGATTDILSADITPSKAPSLFRIMVQVDAVCKFYAMVEVDSTTYTLAFNANADLAADSVYMFDMLVHSGDSVNFQIDSAEVVDILRVQEIPSSL